MTAGAETRGTSGWPAEARQLAIAAVVTERGFVRVRELSERFGVSTVTLRNDLDVLDRRGEVQRVHGGAMSRQALVEPSVEEAASALTREKQAIGRAASQLVRSGDSVIIDVGSTCLSLSQALADRTDLDEVTVFTNGLNVALEFERASAWCAVIVTGGRLRPRQHSLVNPMATGAFASLRATTVFLGCNGVDLDSGVSNINLPEAEVKQAMVRAARRCVVLADGSKLGEVALAPICTLDAVDVLVTDASASPEFLANLRDRGIDIVVADRGSER